MQSSRRKRERSETAIAVTPSAASARRGSARGSTPPQKKLHNSKAETLPANKKPTVGAENGGGQEDKRGRREVNKSQLDSSIDISRTQTQPIPPIGESLERQKAGTNPAPHRKSIAIDAGKAMGGTTGNSRQQQILALLSHRKLLLKRIRQSRQAAQSRLGVGDTVSQQCKTGKAASDSSRPAQSSSQPAAAVPQSSRADKEVEAFRELSRRAVQAARKQRAEEKGEPQVTRVSVSLRRGSSVGKKMNAALSSLAPGNSSTAPPPRSAQLHPTAPPSQPFVPVPTVTSSNPAHPPPIQSSTPIQFEAKKQPIPSQNESAMKASHSIGHETQVKSRKTAGNPKVKKMNARSSILTTSSSSAAGTLPLHLSVAESALPVNRLTHPVVVVPEAAALRKRRRSLQVQLDSMLRKRAPLVDKVLLERRHAGLQSQAEGKSHDPPNVKQKQGDTESCGLPSRRKTHWDRVMEEMRWLSTDFIEERKWKQSSGRLLASAVLEKSASDRAASQMKEPPEPSKSPPQVVATEEEGEALEEEKKVETSDIPEQQGKVQQWRSPPPLPPRPSKYKEIQPDDMKQASSHARIISDMVAKLWDASCGFSKSSVAQQEEAVKNHVRLKRALMGTDEPEGENTPENAVDETLQEADVEVTERSAKEIYEAISNRFSTASDRDRRRTRQRGRQAKQAVPTIGGHPISKVDQRAMEFIDQTWKGNDGVLLHPTDSTKIEDVVVGLLEHVKKEGPHLVVCQSVRLLQWHHFLQKARSYRTVVYGCKGGISNPYHEGIERLSASDIVVTDFSSIDSMAGGNAGVRVNAFRTVVVDQCGFDSGEALKCDGWHSLLRKAKNRKLYRLLIAERHDGDTLDERRELEFLSSLFAFVIGPDVFSQPRRSPTHQVLSWARREVRASMSRSSSKKLQIEDVEKFLKSALATFTFSTELRGQKSLEEAPIFDVQLCKMSPAQRAAYDQCAVDARGALSLVGTQALAVKALVRLRHVCLHADHFASLEQTEFVSGSLMLPGRWSASQPNSAMAETFMSKSCKFRELVGFLKTECGVERSVDATVAIGNQDKRKKGKKTAPKKARRTKRVVIISSIQSLELTSEFLSCAGIHHDVIGPTGGNDSDALMAVHRERKLLSFNDIDFETNQQASRVLLTSLTMVAADTLGIGIRNADVIICLDEEWSGREASMMATVVDVQSKKEEPARFVRFVCADTCEEQFLLCEDEDSEVLNGTSWARNKEGYFVFEKRNGGWLSGEETASLAIQNASNGFFHFPASNIMHCHGRPLAEVVCTTKPLPVNLFSGEGFKFLPLGQPMGELFIRCLIDEETRISTAFRHCKEYDESRSLPTGVLGRHDALVISSRSYLERFRNKHKQFGFSLPRPVPDVSNTAHATPTQRGQSANATGNRKRAEISDKEVCLSDTLQAMMFYECRKSGAYLSQDGTKLPLPSNDAAGKQVILQANAPTSTRQNAFALLFSRSRWNQSTIAADSNQGTEPLVYFPPIVPGVASIAKQAASEISALSQQRRIRNTMPSGGFAAAESNVQKRALGDGVEFPTSKRPRIHGDAASMFAQLAPAKPITAMHAQAYSLPKREEANAKGKSSPIVRPAPGAFFLRDLNEDFGIFGVGALPDAATSRRFSRSETVSPSQTQALTGWNTSSVPFSRASDPEDADAHSSTSSVVVLFVKRRSGVLGGILGPSPSILPSHHHAAWSSGPGLSGHLPYSYSSGIGNGWVGDGKSNGVTMPKKKKKNPSGSSLQHGAIAALDMSIRASATAGPNGKGKEAYRRIAPTQAARKYGFAGSSLFEAANFRVSTVRLTGRVAHRVLASMNGDTKGSGSQTRYYQNDYPDEWISLVAPLHAKAASQQTLLHHNAFIPRKVAFGPFHVGALSPAMFPVPKTAAPSLGISLPMGVKVALHSEDEQSWTALEDEALQKFASRFANNWHLVARALTIFNKPNSGIDKSRVTNSVMVNKARTAKQCSKRMELLTLESKVPLTDALSNRKIEDEGYELVTSVSTRTKPTDKETVRSLIIRRENQSGEGKATPTKRSFSAFRIASSKKQDIPMAIPGGVAGQEPTMAPPHASHHQALQAAVAAMSSGGRAEMWPLQILDLGDKQRAKARSQTRSQASRPPVGASWSAGYNNSPQRMAPARGRPTEASPHRGTAGPGGK